MIHQEKENLIEILKTHNIEDGIKWFVVDKHSNILGFKTKPYIDKKSEEWKSLPVIMQISIKRSMIGKL